MCVAGSVQNVHYLAYIREIKRGNSVYLAKVTSVRENGKVKQKVLADVGTKEDGRAVIKTALHAVQVRSVKRYADIKVLLDLSHDLELPSLLGRHYKSILAIVVGHLLCKGSILKMASWVEHTMRFEHLGTEALSTKALDEALDHLNALSFERVEATVAKHWAQLAPTDTKCFVLDVTDTYFAGGGLEAKPTKGKDGKVSKLIQIGLVVSVDNGFPMLHKSYKGNISTFKIFSDLLCSVAALGLSAMVLDRGFYSEENVGDIKKLGLQVIVGMKQTPVIQRQFLDSIDRETIYSAQHQIALKDTIVYAQVFS
jgi:hypothetical protein